MVDHIFVFTGKIGANTADRPVEIESGVMCQAAVAARYHDGGEVLLVFIGDPADAVERVYLVEVVGVSRVTADVAPHKRHRHFAGLVRHHAERNAVFLKQFKPVFTGEGLHEFIVPTETFVVRFVVCGEEVGKSGNIALIGISFIVLCEELLLRLEVEINSV